MFHLQESSNENSQHMQTNEKNVTYGQEIQILLIKGGSTSPAKCHLDHSTLR